MSNDTTIKPDDSTDKLKKRVKEKDYPFVYLVDSTQDVAKDYGAKVTPHVFLFDADRKLAYRGRIDDEGDPTKVTKNRISGRPRRAPRREAGDDGGDQGIRLLHQVEEGEAS